LWIASSASSVADWISSAVFWLLPSSLLSLFFNGLLGLAWQACACACACAWSDRCLTAQVFLGLEHYRVQTQPHYDISHIFTSCLLCHLFSFSFCWCHLCLITRTFCIF
jgi:hypothetical protein